MLLLKDWSRSVYFTHSSMEVEMINDVVLEGIVVKTLKD
jgi:hypothetical protein